MCVIMRDVNEWRGNDFADTLFFHSSCWVAMAGTWNLQTNVESSNPWYHISQMLLTHSDCPLMARQTVCHYHDLLCLLTHFHTVILKGHLIRTEPLILWLIPLQQWQIKSLCCEDSLCLWGHPWFLYILLPRSHAFLEFFLSGLQ